MQQYSISQVAERFNLEPHTIRYYEKEGIISPNKTDKGIRAFTEADADQLSMVCCLKSTGMSIRDIKKYFDLCGQGDATVGERLEIFLDHRQHILDEVECLKKNLVKIERKIAWYKKKHGVE
ncbi:MAG: MerR family transcriptional regulator [Oscillospiraceae bacterium]|jgi:DNA-binding transcriptional MerR regulator|nr:MerR family transcriptional regulator [Oscillospiraceae bacterium]